MDSAALMYCFVRLFVIGFQVTRVSSQVTEEQTPVEGSDLYCYECKENYKKAYDALDSPCLNNVSLVNVRQCLPEHRYCQVERINIKGWSVLSIERGCTTECLYGCRYNGYGVTLKRCYSCCRTKLCNVDDGASYMGHTSRSIVILLLLTLIMQHI